MLAQNTTETRFESHWTPSSKNLPLAQTPVPRSLFRFFRKFFTQNHTKTQFQLPNKPHNRRGGGRVCMRGESAPHLPFLVPPRGFLRHFLCCPRMTCNKERRGRRAASQVHPAGAASDIKCSPFAINRMALFEMSDSWEDKPIQPVGAPKANPFANLAASASEWKPNFGAR